MTNTDNQSNFIDKKIIFPVYTITAGFEIIYIMKFF